ncbi:MAG: hypothetical protein IJ367_01650 [Clostridia bacterium]|nr:hypothetical protein [Clostridia bacterium]
MGNTSDKIALGIDIGTTTVSAIVITSQDGEVLEEVFQMKVQIPSHTEEAAFGAAMFGAQAK